MALSIGTAPLIVRVQKVEQAAPKQLLAPFPQAVSAHWPGKAGSVPIPSGAAAWGAASVAAVVSVPVVSNAKAVKGRFAKNTRISNTVRIFLYIFFPSIYIRISRVQEICSGAGAPLR